MLVAGLTGDVAAPHSHISETAIRGATVGTLHLTGVGLTDVEIDDLQAVVVSASTAKLQTVRVTGGRVATLDLSRGSLTGVEFRGLRIDYLTLAGTTALDVLFVDCTIGALDAPQATLSRVGFENSRVDEVDNRGWRIENVDLRGLEAIRYLDMPALRGATMSERQVVALARDFGTAAGVDIRG